MSQVKEYDDAIESSQWFSDSRHRLLVKKMAHPDFVTQKIRIL